MVKISTDRIAFSNSGSPLVPIDRLIDTIPFDMTSREDRVRTCYMLACLAYVTSQTITNADVRTAFGLEDRDKVKASRIIRDTLELNLIKPVDPTTASRYMRYVPFWA